MLSFRSGTCAALSGIHGIVPRPSLVSALLLVGLALSARGTMCAQAPRAPATAPAKASGKTPVTADTVILRPPVTPKRAFLYSLAVPGAGQAALQRHFWGGVFFAAEGLSLALVHRSAEDLRLARQFRADSVPATYTVDAAGQPVLGGDGRPMVATWTVSRYSAARLRARQTHYEDWLAVVIFNHLIAGADAYVAAQLWDLPARVGMGTAPNGRPAFVATLSFR